MFVIFPYLHKELVLTSVTFDFFILDPGLEQGENFFWTPPNLPLKGKKAEKLFNEALEFVNLHKDPKDLTFWRNWELISDTEPKSFEIRTQLMTMMGEKSHKEANVGVLAQFVLLLYWILEERLLELKRIEKELIFKEDRLYRELGIEHPSYEEKKKEKNDLFFNEKGVFTWKVLIPYFFFFIPEEVKILLLDKEVLDGFVEKGIKFREKEPFLYAELKGEEVTDLDIIKKELAGRSYEVYFWKR